MDEPNVNILLVDDQPNNLVALRATLGGLGQIVTARSGDEALRLLLKHDFAVVLLDVHMPGLDGFQTASLIRQRERTQETPIIFLTAGSQNDINVFHGYSLGAVDYIFKPVVPEILRSKVAVFVALSGTTAALTRQNAELIERRREAESAVRERDATNRDLASAKLEAERANQAKSDFLSRMSHDLRTPLNAILGFAQLLEGDGLTADQQDSVHHILKGGEHLLELINEVLDLARIESGHLSLSPEPVAVVEVAQEVISLIRPLAIRRHITIDDEALSACSDGYVLADRQRLKQVLMNLVSNAIKYNREGGRLTVTPETVADRTQIRITDTGAGIPAAQLALLFQPFERLRAAETDMEGTGLGLALSKALAEAMGGTLGVVSEVGRGSTFWIELAQAPAPTAARPSGSGPGVPASDRHTTGTVLYIEDNPANQRLMERVLMRRPGITLVPAASGQAGIDLATADPPNLILLDLQLPDIDGQTVLRRLREDDRTKLIPVVILSAEAAPQNLKRLLTAGATAYISKPLNIGELLQLLDAALAKAR